MNRTLLELGVILLLLVANGVFAMTEIAVVSARRSRLRQWAAAGDPRAQAALELAEAPNRFLSTVQLGITLVGILAGAFGGATLADEIGQALQVVPGLAAYGEGIGLAAVVLLLTFLSLVVGELVPKRIGLGNPEAIALRMARPMQALGRAAGPVVRFLGVVTDALLRVCPVRLEPAAVVHAEDVKGLMQEGLRAGAFNQVESQIVQSALELDRLAVRDLMTPRAKIIWINQDDRHEAIWHKIVVSGHSNFPVYEGNRDQAVGVVSVKAIYANLAAGAGARTRDLMTKPLVVPASQTALRLLETFKQSGRHIALVADEFGGIAGLVTLNDALEALLGEFPSQEDRAKPQIKRRDDGSWLMDGLVEVDRVQAALPGLRIEPADRRDYQTLAGFVVKQLGHLPREGETLRTQGYGFEVLDMDGHRVDKVLVTVGPASDAAASPGAAPSADG